MDQATINRYQPGGDIYATFANEYGASAANTIAQAALTGDESQVNAALTAAQYGAPLDTSTTDILTQQLETNPLGAPLSDLESSLSNAITDFLTSPAILFVAGLALFFFFGGATLIRNWLKK